jgi:membrane-associated phospholipid phosphatase
MTIAIASLPLVAAIDHRREVASRLGVALPLGWAVSKAIKHLVPRQKPRLLSLTPRQSLPSGHSVATTTLALTLVDAYRAWRAAPIAAAAIGLVGSSRVRAREHRTSEVLIGIGIGVVASVLAGLAARYVHRVV